MHVKLFQKYKKSDFVKEHKVRYEIKEQIKTINWIEYNLKNIGFVTVNAFLEYLTFDLFLQRCWGWVT